MPEAMKERPKTDNSSLTLALTVQPGEGAKGVEVKRDGKEVTYPELERMTLKDLIECKISVLGLEAGYTKAPSNSFDKAVRYNYFWQAFGGTSAGSGYTLDKPAVSALQSAYELAIEAAGGLRLKNPHWACQEASEMSSTACEMLELVLDWW